MAERKIRVLVVDDSSLLRTAITLALKRQPKIEVVGVARDGVEAIEQVARLKPDVVTMDVEMPKMNGLEALGRLMSENPIPVIMVSDHAGPGADATLKALRLGAVDCVRKPKAGNPSNREAFASLLITKVIGASHARVRRMCRQAKSVERNIARLSDEGIGSAADAIVAIGISAGGPQTLTQLMPAFPESFPPIVVTQHMPEQFTAGFANSLNRVARMSVCEASNGDVLETGKVYIAPGGRHMRLHSIGSLVKVRLDRGAEVSGHRPSVDVMFDSLARLRGKRVVALIMTGMGRDGADGIVKLKQAGAVTMAQDESSSLVYGMPKTAAETGAVDLVVGLADIPKILARCLKASCVPA